MTDKKALKVFVHEPGERKGDLFGIFFEDLNHAADGGLYAELVRNRSFEFDPIDHDSYHPLTAWEKVERGTGRVELMVETSTPLNEKNLHYVTVDVIEPGDGVGIKNLGFNTGIPLVKGRNYYFSCYARRDNDTPDTVTVALEKDDGTVVGERDISVESTEWIKYETMIIAEETDYNGRLVLTTTARGKLYLDMVSLFPENTYKNRTNGLREDIAEMLADLKPKFMRFPGGCLVHDGSLNPDDRDSMYRWKNTIGRVEERPPRRNNWRYHQTLGLGYYEYFLFSEDIGAKPIPILPAGYDPHHQRIVPIDELQPWIDDALDLIEFTNGDTSTKWGAIRAALGHPEPFGLEYIGIGNEEVGEPFFERYDYFHRAIKEKYPEIKIINSSGPFAAGSEYERGWSSARKNKSDYVDEHYYQSPTWFLANYDRYDSFKKNDPKVFLGEYASWGNTYYHALVEAAFMTGLENNAHAVGLACYAPLLCNVDYVNWKPDLIWFNNHQTFGTANYYVQKLFHQHQGDATLKVEEQNLDFLPLEEKELLQGKLILAAEGSSVDYEDIVLTNKDTGEVKNFPDCSLEGGATVELDEVNWENYRIAFKGKKKDGRRGFKIYFGYKDKQNRLFWEAGGWQNQDSVVCSDTDGKNACLTQSLFTVETEREYQLELDVTGREIRTYIDCALLNETEDKVPAIKQLYYSASVEDSGDVIIKAINVQEDPVTVRLELAGVEKLPLSGVVYEMSGYQPDDENSFENPTKIAPTERTVEFTSASFEHTFPKQSITVFRFHQACLLQS